MIVSYFEPSHDRLGYRSEPSIGIGTAACWICLMIVLIGITWYESLPFLLYFSRCTTSIPDEESIRTVYCDIRWVIYLLPIDIEVELPSSSSAIHLPIRIDEIARTDSPREIREEVSPGRSCHMYMDEISLIVVQMDAIFGEDSL